MNSSGTDVVNEILFLKIPFWALMYYLSSPGAKYTTAEPYEVNGQAGPDFVCLAVRVHGILVEGFAVLRLNVHLDAEVEGASRLGRPTTSQAPPSPRQVLVLPLLAGATGRPVAHEHTVARSMELRTLLSIPIRPLVLQGHLFLQR